jgi:hypothetical protein
MSSVPVDTPRFGGLNIATGGVAPYTISWYLRFGPYISQDLDSIHGAHPKITRILYTDSAYAVLTVLDAMGAVAKDSAKIFFPRRFCLLGTTADYKLATDTFTLSQWQCDDQFPPFHDIVWQPGNTLVDSTVLHARSFTQVSQIYHLTYTDRVGCRFSAGIDPVVVLPTEVSSLSAHKQTATVFVNGSGQISVQLQNCGNSFFRLYDLLGREVITANVNDGNNLIGNLPELMPSIYLYRIVTNNELVTAGKFYLQPW